MQNSRTGNLIIGDADGLAVIPRQYAEQIIHDAEIHMQTEISIKQGLLNGGEREAVTKPSNRLQHVKPLNKQ